MSADLERMQLVEILKRMLELMESTVTPPIMKSGVGISIEHIMEVITNKKLISMASNDILEMARDYVETNGWTK